MREPKNISKTDEKSRIPFPGRELAPNESKIADTSYFQMVRLRIVNLGLRVWEE